MEYIHSNMNCPLSEVLRAEFEEIDSILCRLMDEAEEQCRRLHMGAHPWSPTYTQANLRIEYWLNRMDYYFGINTNVRQLITLQNKLKIEYNPSLSKEDIRREIRQAFKHRKHVKSIAESLSLEYRTRLAQAKEDGEELVGLSEV